LIELHGGTVRAYSAGKGQGASFVVSLPIRAVRRADAVESPSVLPAVTSDAVNLAGVRVLALDDERDARELVKRILEESGCIVAIAKSIDEALQHLADETFDVVISDIGMPGGDGFQFMRQMREADAAQSRKKIPSIALTAYARPEDRRRVLMAGYQAHIAKPVERGELLAVIASLAGRI
jgi:CheY-like chemotaxis protein